MLRLLDLFCGAGGAAMGYHRAGFDEIVGVDNLPSRATRSPSCKPTPWSTARRTATSSTRFTRVRRARRTR